MAKKRTNQARTILFQITFAVLLGALGAFITIAFIEALELIQDTIWLKLPGKVPVNTYLDIILITTLGGLLVGLTHNHIGPYPESLEQAMERFKKTGKFDYQHIVGAMIASIAALGFGAALGPEAALIAVVGGLGTWIAMKLNSSEINLREAGHIGLSASLGAVFSSVAALAVAPQKKKAPNTRDKLLVLIPSFISAVVALLIVKNIGSGGYFNYDFLHYGFNARDLIYVMPVAAAAIIAGLVFLLSLRYLSSLVKHQKINPVVVSAFSGLALGLMATWSVLVLFSGHEAVQLLIDSNHYLSGEYLVKLGLVKAFTASLLLATFWKGGRFFPMIFAGAAVGIGVSHYFQAIDPMVGLAAGIGAGLTTVVPKPLIVVLLLALIFPLNLALFALGGVIIAWRVSKVSFLKPLYQESNELYKSSH